MGEQFQGYLRSWVGHLRDLVGFLKDNSDWLVKFGEAAIFVAGAIVTYGIITKIAGIASAVEGLALALTANPIALLLTGVVAGGAIICTKTSRCRRAWSAVRGHAPQGTPAGSLQGQAQARRRKEDGLHGRPGPRDHLREEAPAGRILGRLQRRGPSENQDPGQGRTLGRRGEPDRDGAKEAGRSREVGPGTLHARRRGAQERGARPGACPHRGLHEDHRVHAVRNPGREGIAERRAALDGGACGGHREDSGGREAGDRAAVHVHRREERCRSALQAQRLHPRNHPQGNRGKARGVRHEVQRGGIAPPRADVEGGGRALPEDVRAAVSRTDEAEPLRVGAGIAVAGQDRRPGPFGGDCGGRPAEESATGPTGVGGRAHAPGQGRAGERQDRHRGPGHEGPDQDRTGGDRRPHGTPGGRGAQGGDGAGHLRRRATSTRSATRSANWASTRRTRSRRPPPRRSTWRRSRARRPRANW